ncbi:uncharacterized protein LAJ45_03714 [Morchella importuna]|uniref:Uncharacterized protein n=1 Tax=Morchella conica CCBAS932 TaxID=1392247 RepID=A0A3N4KDT1_9PEZI|nr:uncharacterized protein LAJ45_03714 [Morchella importuna]KAH8152287.1 hypothetical protein LAJ45_03714 [Morchella importuna]RPB07492.1 hypothetical protein P167DRAFT_579181 [Morchella conica CCBAS932]
MRTRSTRNAKKRLASPAPSPPPPPESALAALIEVKGDHPNYAAHLQYLEKHPEYTQKAAWSVFIHLSLQRLSVRYYNRVVYELRAAPRGMSIAAGREWARRVFRGGILFAEEEVGDVWGVVRAEMQRLRICARVAEREMDVLWRVVQAWKEEGWDGRKAICWAHYERRWMGRLRREGVVDDIFDVLV